VQDIIVTQTQTPALIVILAVGVVGVQVQHPMPTPFGTALLAIVRNIACVEPALLMETRCMFGGIQATMPQVIIIAVLRVKRVLPVQQTVPMAPQTVAALARPRWPAVRVVVNVRITLPVLQMGPGTVMPAIIRVVTPVSPVMVPTNTAKPVQPLAAPVRQVIRLTQLTQLVQAALTAFLLLVPLVLRLTLQSLSGTAALATARPTVIAHQAAWSVTQAL